MNKMGLNNDIKTKEDLKCSECGKSLRWDTEHPSFKGIITFQSKDLSDRCNCWYVGERITLELGGLIFKAEGDDKWSGCNHCPHCKAFLDVDIIIKEGVIKEIKNIRKWKY